jgi:SAM-dependent methyltransferase
MEEPGDVLWLERQRDPGGRRLPAHLFDGGVAGRPVDLPPIGPELAAIARRNLAPYRRAHVVVADFEQWPLPAAAFDAVVVATAFHWLDPLVRVTKTADALRAGGTLALIDTDHVAGGTESFFVEVQTCHERWDPKTEPGLQLPRAADVDPRVDEFEAGRRFGPVEVRRYETDIAYSTSEYRELLLTYSGHLAMPASARVGLLDCIAALIDTRYGGRIVKRYLTSLRLANRVPRA